jgi:hypothetical protein
MELITFPIPKSLDKFVLAPIGDIQWSGENGPTAKDQLRYHIDECLERNAYFFGVGDYTDFLSPSNRQRLVSAGLYDTAYQVMYEKAMELMLEVFDKFLKPTVGRWIGLLEGHHFFESEGETTDTKLAELLKTKFLGTSAFVKVPSADFVFYAHHGTGGGTLPGSGLNKLYHTAAGLQGAEVYLMGHNCKLAATPLARPFPKWGKKNGEHDLDHRDVYLLNCGGFSKSNVVGHRVGGIIRGDYPEKGMMTPATLSAPIITVNLKCKSKEHRTRVEL